MWRRSLIVLLALAAALGLGAAGLLAFRTAIVDWAVERRLAALGVPAARLTVESFGWNRVRIADLHAGQAGELELAELVIAYPLRPLLGGQLGRVDLKGLGLRLDLTGERPPLGSLQAPLHAMLAGSKDDEGAGVDLPEITLEGGQIEVLTPVGPAKLDLEGRVEPQDGGAIATQINLALRGGSGQILGRLRAEATPDRRITGGLRIDQGSISLGDDGLAAKVLGGGLEFAWRDERVEALKGELALEDIRLAGAGLGAASIHIDGSDRDLSAGARLGTGVESFDLQVQARIRDLPSAPRIESQLHLMADASAPFWRLLPLAQPSAGGAELTLEIEGLLPKVAIETLQREELLPLLLEHDLSATMALDLDRFAVPDYVSGVSGTFTAQAKSNEGGLDLSGLLDGALDAQGLPARWLAAAGLPEQLLGQRINITLGNGERAPLTARLSPDDRGAELDLNGTLAIGARDHLDLSAAGGAVITLDRSFEPSGLTLKGLKLEATSKALAGTPIADLSFSGDLSGSFTTAEADGEAPRRLDHEIVVDRGKLRFEIAREGEAPFTVEATTGRVTLSGAAAPEAGYLGKAVLEGGRITFPEIELALDGLSAEAPLNATGLDEMARFAAAAVRDLHEPPNFHPLRLAGGIKPRGEIFHLTARLSGPGEAGHLSVTGWLDPAKQRGDLRADLRPLEFKPESVQPGMFSPWLEGLARVSGRMQGGARIAWNPAGAQSNATIDLNDLFFETESVKVEGLRLGLKLDDLLAPSSPPSQVLVAEQIDPGVPLRDLSVRFRVLTGKAPRVLVEQAEFSAVGGRYRLAKTVIDPARPRQKIELRVIELELAELFEAIGIEGLSGKGLIGGTVPLTIGPEGVVVSHAALAARTPGLLKFKSPTAAQALQAGGEPVELMLQALEDFHYETLNLTVSKDADGEVRLRIELLGKNPQVRGGHPFKFNINLTGNLNPLLSAIAQGREISSDFLSRTWRLRP